jgi:superfamily I DNA/RNA helicase
LAHNKYSEYDVVIIDEAQDFSANQIRAVLNQLAEDHSLTLVLDAAQRIYAHAFQWQEVNISLSSHDIFPLKVNHRNTIEVAQFALPLLQGLDLTSDGTMPDFKASDRHGAKPIVLKGLYSDQVRYALRVITTSVDLEKESVAFLHPKGWFQYLRRELRRRRLPFVEITGSADWPEGDENIALSTMHSAKGLEFDHVFVLGLNQEVTQHGDEEGDADLENLRRLFAMAVSRSRQSFTLGYKPDDASSLIDLLDPATYTVIDV